MDKAMMGCDGATVPLPPSSPADAPLVQALAAAAAADGVASFHFPGHIRGRAATPGLLRWAADLPVELPELEPALPLAQRRAAELFGSDAAFFLVNGSTSGIHAAVMATCPPDAALLLPRNSHISAISALVLSGAAPVFVMPEHEPNWDIAHAVSTDSLSNALCRPSRRRIGAVLVTSPTYHGLCSDVRSISEVCHRHGVPLIVDEAHGAHFHFHDRLPPPALAQGADIVVQSTHKVLTSLTQSAMLHVQGDLVDRDAIGRSLQAIQSSSPSALLLASLDASRAQAAAFGAAAFSSALQLAEKARHALRRLRGLDVLELESVSGGSAVAKDPLRLTVGVWRLGLSGYEADEILRVEHGVVAELPSLRTITFAISWGTTEQDIEALIKSFEVICGSGVVERRDEAEVHLLPPELPRAVMTPREAFFAAAEAVAAEEVEGRVSAELVCPYPPGIPVLVPGERIGAAAVEYLRAVRGKGGVIQGASDESLETLRVVRELDGKHLRHRKMTDDSRNHRQGPTI